MTRTAGRVVHAKGRALTELIRVTSRLVAPAGCARRDAANARLRFHHARCPALLPIARKVHDLICGTSSHPAAHGGDAACRDLVTSSKNCSVVFSDSGSSGQRPAPDLDGQRASAHGFGLRHRVACCYPAGLLAPQSRQAEVVGYDASLDFPGQRCGRRSATMLPVSVENVCAQIRSTSSRRPFDCFGPRISNSGRGSPTSRLPLLSAMSSRRRSRTIRLFPNVSGLRFGC